MTEAVLKYAWKYKCFQSNSLYTVDGVHIEILKPGMENRDAGPDFFLAKLKLDGVEWIGNVEIHVNASDWPKHNHHLDRTYDNVILHVVYNYDGDVHIKGRKLPTMELKGILSDTLLKNFHSIQEPFKLIPCEKLNNRVDEFHKSTFLSRLLIERISDRGQNIEELLNQNSDDLVESFYQFLCIGFGQRVNKAPFELLSRKLPMRVIRKYTGDLFRIETLLYGVAGFLSKPLKDNDYHKVMRTEFEYLKTLHNLEEMEVSNWKFLRMRPGSFPTIRISQLAGFLNRNYQVTILFSEMHPIKLYHDIFNLTASEYWNTHFTFRKESAFMEKITGKDFINHLLINTIFPFTFYLGQRVGRNFGEHIEHHYKSLHQEVNLITRKMSKAGFFNENAAHSQALLQLNAKYCEPKNCLNCNIGYQALKL